MRRKVRRGLSAVLMSAAVVASACGSDSVATTQPSSSITPSLSTSSLSTGLATTGTVAVTAPSPAAAAPFDPRAALTQTVDNAFYPPFTRRIPAHWTAVLRDIWAFQVYFGNEDFEITFDHTYQRKESVDDAIARLASTAGLIPGPVSPVVVGGLAGKGFVGESQSAVRFLDSGFHTNLGSRLEVIAIPMEDGTTVSIFFTASADPEHGVDALGQLARRIFETVHWK